MKLQQALVSFLVNKADDNDVVNVYNEYAEADDFIFNSIEDIADMFPTNEPVTLMRMVYFGDVESWCDKFFALDGYGNIYSFNRLTDRLCPIDFKLLAEQIIENQQFTDVNFDAGPYLSDDE